MSEINIAQLTGSTDENIVWLSDNKGLHQQVITPWQQLCLAAKKDGFQLDIASGFRSFERQLNIWNRKCRGELAIKNIDNQLLDINQLSKQEVIDAILTFSALPGTSRHHWGTEIDFYSQPLLADQQILQLEEWEYENKGPFAELTKWLNEHAQQFGFYFPYDKYRGGVAKEPWHLSYFPLAEQYQNNMSDTELAVFLKASELVNKEIILEQLSEIFARYVVNTAPYPLEFSNEKEKYNE